MKKLDQSVFVGAPDWVEWFFIDHCGGGWWSDKKPKLGASKIYDGKCYYIIGAANIKCTGEFDPTDWKNSLTRRDRCNGCPNKTDGVCCGQAV